MSRLAVGRPLCEGVRYPSGGPEPVSRRDRAARDHALSLSQASAIAKLQNDLEAAQTSRRPDRRLGARQAVDHALAALPARCRAIIDLVVIRGRPLQQVVALSGQPMGQLADLLKSAASALADHYEAQPRDNA